MKKLTNMLAIVLFSTTLLLTASSCQKNFDAKSYAPSKPLPSYDGFTASDQIEPASRVAYWPFSGSLTDSISNMPGVASGTSFSAGIAGQGFQGADQHYAICDAPTGIENLHSFTLSLWVNTPPPSTGVIGIFSLVNTKNFWGNLELFFENGSDNTNGKLRVHMSQNGTDNTYAVDGIPNLFNAWVNITVTYSQADGVCLLYVNGAQANKGSAGITGPLAFTNVGKIVFGCVQFMTVPSQTAGSDAQPWASYLTGKEDQVRLYNIVLPAKEIKALYNLDLSHK